MAHLANSSLAKTLGSIADAPPPQNQPVSSQYKVGSDAFYAKFAEFVRHLEESDDDDTELHSTCPWYAGGWELSSAEPPRTPGHIGRLS